MKMNKLQKAVEMKKQLDALLMDMSQEEVNKFDELAGSMTSEHLTVKDKEFEGLDRLEAIYKMQTGLDEMIIKKHKLEGKFTAEEWVKNLLIADLSETNEVLDELNWKWWKNPKEVNWSHVQEEIIDKFHFLMAMSRHAKLTPTKIYKTYVAKYNENVARQEGRSLRKGYNAEEVQHVEKEK